MVLSWKDYDMAISYDELKWFWVEKILKES